LLVFSSRRKLALLLQSEAAECGLASLAMVAAYHGHRVTLAELRRRFAVSLKGTTLKTMIALADGLGLAARPVRLDLAELADLKLPCVLHWDLSHYVVLILQLHFKAKRDSIHPYGYAGGVDVCRGMVRIAT